MDNSLHPGTTKTLLIVYHSVTGGTRQMVEAAARGAALEPAMRVRLLSAPLAQAADLLEADGYIFGTPENLEPIPITRRGGRLSCNGKDKGPYPGAEHLLVVPQ
jgi:hypothetical protein